MATYSGPSVVDYLNSVGQATDYASRAQLAASKGIAGYVGSAEQNTQLLNLLRGGATGAPIAQAPTASPTPVAQSQATSSIAGGGDTELQQLAKTDRNPVQEGRYQELLKQQQSSGIVGGQTPSFTQPTINLPELYKGLYDNSGIKDIENELSDKSRAYTDQVAKIKDNPYLAEATMTGRLSKLQDKFNADTQNIRNDIAMRKADIETQLSLQTKQFDINSQQAQQEFQKFQTLLGAGALNNASGEDIASITRATGLSSSMIQSAINASKAKDASTSTIQFDDGTNQGFVIINDKTGEIINRQIIGASKPTKGTAAQTKAEETSQNTANLTESIKNGVTLKSLVNAFYPALSIDDIYRLYNSFSPNGAAKETLAQVKQGTYASDKNSGL